MAEDTAIEWADHTFNPWEGCQKTGSLACEHCYAETRNARFNGGVAVNWGPHAPRRRTSASNWRKPLAWNKAARAFAEKHGRKQRVFCASLADVFDNAVDPEWRRDLFAIIDATPNLDWLLLTKRVGNVVKLLEQIGRTALPVHVWLGATIVTQEEAERDIPKLLAAPAVVRFLSMEPLMGPVDLTDLSLRTNPGEKPDGLAGLDALTGVHWDAEDTITGIYGSPDPRIDWVIVGGESGSGARPMHPDWARSIRDQCAAAEVPLLFKQWGEWESALDRDRDDPDWRADYTNDYVDRGKSRWLNLAGGSGFHGERFHVMRRVGKKAAGRLLDGVQHDGVPM